MLTRTPATIEDLYNVPENGKAEIVNGELIRMSPTGAKSERASGMIYSRLLRHEEEHGGGYAIPDNVGFIVSLPNRGSFSPDAAWYTGNIIGMEVLQGPPAFAVEVRSANDYGPAEERAILDKIADYFAAGTQVVWDVDLLGTDVVCVYRSTQPTVPVI